MNHIISKWVVKYKDWHLAITPDSRVFDLNTKAQLVEYWNNGTIAFRLPNTTKRIGVKTIRQNCVKSEIIVKFDYPF
jgi:hypothetical protein